MYIIFTTATYHMYTILEYQVKICIFIIDYVP